MDESVHVDQDDSVVGAPGSGDYNKDLEEHVGILVLAEDTTQAGGPHRVHGEGPVQGERLVGEILG